MNETIWIRFLGNLYGRARQLQDRSGNTYSRMLSSLYINARIHARETTFMFGNTTRNRSRFREWTESRNRYCTIRFCCLLRIFSRMPMNFPTHKVAFDFFPIWFANIEVFIQWAINNNKLQMQLILTIINVTRITSILQLCEQSYSFKIYFVYYTDIKKM